MENIKHECGIAMIRLRKPLEYYKEKYGTQVRILHNRILEISSTEIKERIRDGRSIREFVPYEIERYIDEHGLYQDLY